MRNHKITILAVFPISLIILIVAVLFEFHLIDMPHSNFYQNITLGIFASAILIVMTSVVSYNCKKTTYYTEQFSDISEMIVYAKTLLEAMKQKDPNLKSHLFFDAIELRFNNVKIRILCNPLSNHSILFLSTETLLAIHTPLIIRLSHQNRQSLCRSVPEPPSAVRRRSPPWPRCMPRDRFDSIHTGTAFHPS